ncbi:MAG: aldehyde dehydrogenase family protein [Halobacteriovoraceae bacterium]|jgi:RHH-type transcriptional regulator, proline utilization regulon repressor / proline dehydrogenase / delta 1-pyrroline-5-carboxylate dehydrogenase|nr:aldehyde dehydrogenase family protein [Halobacteriovoraceae bacterium]
MTGMPETVDPLLGHLLQKIEKLDLGSTGYAIYFNSDFKELLTNEEVLYSSVVETLKPYLIKKFQPFRYQINIQSVPFLVAIFPAEKEVRLYGPRLAQELFLVNAVEGQNSHESVRKVTHHEDYDDFKKHISKIAAMSSKRFPSILELVTEQNNLPNLLEVTDNSEVEKNTGKIINELLIYLNDYRPNLFERITDWGLGLTASYALLRIHLLKFLAILPSLDYDLRGHEVKRIFLESLRRVLKDSHKAHFLAKRGQERALPMWMIFGLRLTFYSCKVIPAGILTATIRFKVRFMAKRFIAGESIEKSESSLRELYKSGRDVTLDQLGELVVSEKEADQYRDEVLKLINGFSIHVPKGERNSAGILRAHVSIKVSALCSDFKPQAFEYTYKLVAPRLIKILIAAKAQDVFLNIDAEHYDYRDIVFKIYEKVLIETEELKDFGGTGIVLQAYLRDAAIHLNQILELAKKRKLCMPVRLVKGAYWDAETVEADAHSFVAPEFLNKEETDLHFRQMIIKIFEASPHLQLCLASHNFSDHSYAEAIRTQKFKSSKEIEHQCLHMTYEALSTAMAKMGWAVRNYVPIGSLLVGMAYLVRRIMENSSQVGVLTIMRSHKKQKNMLGPEITHLNKIKKGHVKRDSTQLVMSGDFFNVAPVRLFMDHEKAPVLEEIENFQKNDLNKDYVNQFQVTGEEHIIKCSSNPKWNVGSIKFATKSDAEKAVGVISDSYLNGAWAQCPWVVRAIILTRAANLLLSNRSKLCALITHEAGKSIDEALGDVDEAIDFLNFYAREEGRINYYSPQAVSRGPIAVISPWNFPLAIPCGMVAAALVAGNTVILKSAEQTPLVAQVLVDLLHRAGVPKDVLIHLPGAGEIVGESLVNSQSIAGIVFTGSKAVGVGISSKASKRVVENKLFEANYPVKVITEMGGKNAIIVTANAELDETVSGILYSAFGHAGQKCSACSRIIVDNTVKERLVERLREAVHDLNVGESFNFSTAVNPIITVEDQKRIRQNVIESIDQVKVSGGRIIIDRSNEELPGYCVGPTVIEVPFKVGHDPESFAQREIFGPVVHLIGYDQLDQAIDLFNATDYALTGGVFSQSQDDIDYLTERLESGNLYVNRSITGARVAIEPFGGFKLSGTGPKAGSKNYLASFHHHLAGQLKSSQTPDSSGPDVDFKLCLSSKLPVERRLKVFLLGLDIFLAHFEEMFQGIYSDQKNILLKFQKWCVGNLANFQASEHPNRIIPGQLNYNNFGHCQERVVAIAYEERPYYITLMHVLSALAMGSGVTILTRNESAYSWWSSFQTFYIQAGLGEGNLNVLQISQKSLKQTLKNPLIDSLIIDGPLENYIHITEAYDDFILDSKRVRQVLTPFDAPSRGDFKAFCRQFTNVRAFAINTMRHGAPMGLDL